MWSEIACDAFALFYILFFLFFLAEGMTPTVETNLFFEICPTNLLAGTEHTRITTTQAYEIILGAESFLKARWSGGSRVRKPVYFIG